MSGMPTPLPGRPATLRVTLGARPDDSLSCLAILGRAAAHRVGQEHEIRVVLHLGQGQLATV